MALTGLETENRGNLPPDMTTIAPRPTPRGSKAKLRQALMTRGLKQAVLGTGFLTLLGAGWLYPVLGYFIPACMVLGLGIAAVKGRSWCDWLCPRGSFEDAWLARISRQARIPAVFRRTAVRVAVMALLMGILTWQIIRLWPDPWAIGGAFVLLLTITTGVGVVLGVGWQQRTWCYICPIGTMSNWLGKNRNPLSMTPEKCTQCNLCTHQCPMQLSPAALKDQDAMPDRGDCLKCSLCVASCPRGALAFSEDRRAA